MEERNDNKLELKLNFPDMKVTSESKHKRSCTITKNRN